MNDHQSSAPANIPDAQWQAQERALRAERLGMSTHADDATAQTYRQVARALRQPLPDPLPVDFARQMARMVQPARPMTMDERVLAWLIRGLLVALGLSTVILLGLDGARWWQSLVTLLPVTTLTNPWLLSLAVCATLTGLLGRRPRRHTAGLQASERP